MIEESARVVAVVPGHAWVETRRRNACASCTVSSSCGTSVVSKLFDEQTNRLQVSDNIGVEVGDQVIIGIAEGALTRASLLAYLLPLIVLMLAVYAARAAGAGEGLSALAGILGLCLGMWVSGRLTGAATRREGYRPILLRKSEACTGMAPLAVLEAPDP